MMLQRSKVIAWAASKRSSRYAHAVLIALALSLLLIAIYDWPVDRLEQRVRGTRLYLSAMRTSIAAFSEMNGRYPHSLQELWDWYGSAAPDVVPVGFKVEKRENVAEYRQLNGKGGFYYDPNTGEVRLNLTEPVKNYFPGYKGKYADEIPSSW